jgi:hypothetical protein
MAQNARVVETDCIAASEDAEHLIRCQRSKACMIWQAVGQLVKHASAARDGFT